MICFTTVTHLINHKVIEVWAAMHKIYQMYWLCGFHIVEIDGNGEFAWIADQVASLRTNPILNLAAALDHVGLIEGNICFLKEKTRLIRHSLPFKRIPAFMLIRMVLHIVQFMKGFPQKRGLKHYPLSAIMTGAKLHMSQLQLKFGSYCQVAEDVTPCNSLAARTCRAISMGPSGNLSGGQRFLALDTGKLFVRKRWKELPMPLAVINHVNVLGRAKRSMLVFTDCLGCAIGDHTPTVNEAGEEDESVVNDLYSSIPPAPAGMPGVSLIEEGSADEIPGVDLPDVAVLNKPTGVDMGCPQAVPPQDAVFDDVFDDAVFDTALDDGLNQQAVAEPETQAASPKEGMAARNTWNRKQPEKYIPSMQGNEHQVALAQITTSLGSSKTSMAFAMMFVKLMNKGTCQHADVVGMVMAQVSLKAALKKWGREAEESVGKEMKQLHWQNSFKPMHWKSLTAKQCVKVLESHIFVERKQDGVFKAQQVAGGNMQRGYIMKEDASSPTVSSEAVMLTCIVNANENREVVIVDISNAFVQTVVKDEKGRAFIRIRGPLVNIMVSIAPDVYGPYITVGKKGSNCLTNV
jgi:hypothetical protein